jgi:uncharacterized protein YjbI with pentapeptide repeats
MVMKREAKLDRELRTLASRWEGEFPAVFEKSPFGVTKEGRQDFRGAKIPVQTGKRKPTLAHRKIKGADLTGADMSGAIFEDCVFEDCLISHVLMQDSTLCGGGFFNCAFENVDLCLTGLGFGTGRTVIESCTFSKLKLMKVSFSKTTFRNIIFRGRQWSNVDFDNAEFWDCKFEGLFKNCVFGKSYEWLAEQEEFVDAERTGFFAVDLSEASFLLCSFRPNWIFGQVQYPKDGSLALVRANSIRQSLNNYEIDSAEHKILSLYISIFVDDQLNDQKIPVSSLDFRDLGDEAVGMNIFKSLIALREQ